MKCVACPFPGFNVGCVSEGGVTEQEAGLQVSLQLHCKSSKWAQEWLPKPFAKEQKKGVANANPYSHLPLWRLFYMHPLIVFSFSSDCQHMQYSSGKEKRVA